MEMGNRCVLGGWCEKQWSGEDNGWLNNVWSSVQSNGMVVECIDLVGCIEYIGYTECTGYIDYTG